MYDDRNDTRKVDISIRLGGWGPMPDNFEWLTTVQQDAREAFIALDNPETTRAHNRFNDLIDALMLINYGHFHSYERYDVDRDRIAACIDAVEAWQLGADTHRYCERLRAALRRRSKSA